MPATSAPVGSAFVPTGKFTLTQIGDLQFNSASFVFLAEERVRNTMVGSYVLASAQNSKFDDMRVPPVYGLVGVKCLRIWRICFDMPGGSPFLFVYSYSY